MIYSVYHPEGFYMCDVEIREEDSSFNKAQINDPESEVYNSKLPKWVKRPTQRAADLGQAAANPSNDDVAPSG